MTEVVSLFVHPVIWFSQMHCDECYYNLIFQGKNLSFNVSRHEKGSVIKFDTWFEKLWFESNFFPEMFFGVKRVVTKCCN